jgi:allophanate hydrolase
MQKGRSVSDRSHLSVVRDRKPQRLATGFDFASLRRAAEAGIARPADIVREAYRRIREDDRPGVWITLRAEAEALALADRLPPRPSPAQPLAGLPFAVKDNIDVAGLPTTAACPAYSYVPERSATVVAALEAAGAICIGKTNLDQFATGLSGTRSPYGACGAAHDPAYVAGGSSSGSAVATALHQVAFALGTDTGGSGRIPAGLNNVVGLKPTVGVLSTQGVVPNCRTLDCVSIFALSVADALEVARLARTGDAADASLRGDWERATFVPTNPAKPVTIAVPEPDQLEFFGNEEGRALFAEALARLERLGARLEPIDLAPFLEIGRELFEGPWIAERAAAFGGFVKSNAADVLPLTRKLVERARSWSAVDTFAAVYRQRNLQSIARGIFESAEALVVPTVAPLYTIAEIEADPVARNDHHGHYSYFANILDLCAVSVPSGFYQRGMPFGVTFLAPALHDGRVAGLAAAFHGAAGLPPGRPRTPP